MAYVPDALEAYAVSKDRIRQTCTGYHYSPKAATYAVQMSDKSLTLLCKGCVYGPEAAYITFKRRLHFGQEVTE